MSGHVLTPDALRRNGRPAARKPVVAEAGGSWLGWLGRTLRTLTTRSYLTEMDARMLKDIGITRAEAVAEASRAPWDLAPKPLPRHHPRAQ